MDRDALVLAHLPRVRYLASTLRRGMPPCVEVEDIVSDGVVGLLKAADSFDPDRGVQFWTFAQPRVFGAMVDGMRHDQGRRQYRADRPLVVALDRHDAQEAPRQFEASLRASRARFVIRALRQVRPREAVVFVASLRGERLHAIARRLGVCESRASQLRQRVLRALTHAQAA